MYLFIVITFPIAWPIAFVLNKILGVELGNVYDKNKMKKLFLQYE